MTLTNYTSQMLCFSYNYHYCSKLNSHRGLWGIFATSPQRKDSVVALWESIHRSLCLFFRESAVIYFFLSYRYAHISFSTSFQILWFIYSLLNNVHFSVSRQTSWPDDNTQLYARANLLSCITMDLIFVNKTLIFPSNKIYCRVGYTFLVFVIL